MFEYFGWLLILGLFEVLSILLILLGLATLVYEKDPERATTAFATIYSIIRKFFA